MKDLTVKELMQYLADTYNGDTLNFFEIFNDGSGSIKDINYRDIRKSYYDNIDELTKMVRNKIGEPKEDGGFTLEDLEFAFKSGYEVGWTYFAKQRGYIQEKLEPGTYWRYNGYTDWNKLESSLYEFGGAIEIKIVE